MGQLAVKDFVMKFLRIIILIFGVNVFYIPVKAQYEIMVERFSPNKKYGKDISHIDRSAFYSPDYFNSNQKIRYTPEYTIASGFSVKYDVFNYKISFQQVDEQYYLYIDFLSKKPDLNLNGVDSTVFEFKNGSRLVVPITMSANRLDIKASNKSNAWTSYAVRSEVPKSTLEIFANTQLISVSQRFKSLGVVKANVVDNGSYYLAMSATYFLTNVKIDKSTVTDRFVEGNSFKYNNSKWDY